MKAKVIETGKIFEVERHEYNRELKKMIFFDKNRREYKEDEIEIVECGKYYDIPVKHIDWEQRRYELAKSAMQGLLINPKILELCDTGIQVAKKLGTEIEATDFYAGMAISYADAVIEKLKKL